MTVLSVTDTDYLPLPGSDELLALLPTPTDLCFCCEQPLGTRVHCLGDGVNICASCDGTLRLRRMLWIRGGRP